MSSNLTTPTIGRQKPSNILQLVITQGAATCLLHSMEFSPHEIAPAMRERDPKDVNIFLVQGMLAGRNPAGEEEWVERYAATFRRLYESDQDFHALVVSPIEQERLVQIQECLDAHLAAAGNSSEGSGDAL